MSPERRGGESGKEHEQQPYYQAARFQREGPARRAYFAAQDTIHGAECDLSTYRLLLNGIWHVAVVGEQPPAELNAKLIQALRAGDAVPLPDDVLLALTERREEQQKRASWVERHYR